MSIYGITSGRDTNKEEKAGTHIQFLDDGGITFEEAEEVFVCKIVARAYVKDGELVYAGFLIKASVDCNENNPRFIVGQLRTPRYWKWVAATSMRSGQPGINGKEYSSFEIPVASKKEQDAIAKTLLTFDTHIANLSELILDGVSRATHSGPLRVSSLDHEVFDDPVEDRSVVEAFLGKLDEVACGNGHVVMHLDLDVTH